MIALKKILPLAVRPFSSHLCLHINFLLIILYLEELKSFKEAYNTEKIYEYDEKIKIKLKSQILSVRKELSEYKLNKTVNTAYANMNKNNLNIFSRKV